MIYKNLTKQDVENFRILLDFFRQLLEDGVSPLIEKSLLSSLDNAIPFFSSLVKIDEFPEICRFSINKRILGENRRIHDIKHLKYPPSEKVSKYGRCNYPGQSILYASFLHFTALTETRPSKGDLITQSFWRAKPNEKLKFCPIFKNQPKNNIINENTLELNEQYLEKLSEYPIYVREQIDDLVQFIADAFTKYIRPDSHFDYIFSSFFSNKIFNDFENGTIEAIYYPSVKQNLSFENIAIKPKVFDEKYELVKVKDCICEMDLSMGKGGYFFHGLSECESFDYTSGKILWEPNDIRQPITILNELKKKYNIILNC